MAAPWSSKPTFVTSMLHWSLNVFPLPTLHHWIMRVKRTSFNKIFQPLSRRLAENRCFLSVCWANENIQSNTVGFLFVYLWPTSSFPQFPAQDSALRRYSTYPEKLRVKKCSCDPPTLSPRLISPGFFSYLWVQTIKQDGQWRIYELQRSSKTEF